MVEATVGRSLMRRTPKNAYGLLDGMALNALVGNLREGNHLDSQHKHTSYFSSSSGRITKAIESNECFITSNDNL